MRPKPQNEQLPPPPPPRDPAGRWCVPQHGWFLVFSLEAKPKRVFFPKARGWPVCLVAPFESKLQGARNEGEAPDLHAELLTVCQLQPIRCVRMSTGVRCPCVGLSMKTHTHSKQKAVAVKNETPKLRCVHGKDLFLMGSEERSRSWLSGCKALLILSMA